MAQPKDVIYEAQARHRTAALGERREARMGLDEALAAMKAGTDAYLNEAKQTRHEGYFRARIEASLDGLNNE